MRRGAALPVSVDEVLAALGRSDPLDRKFSRPSFQQRVALFKSLGSARTASQNGERGAATLYQAKMKEAQNWVFEDKQTYLGRATFSAQGFRERLVAFWADHFTISGKNLRGMLTIGAYLDEAIRPNINGTFVDLMKAAILHPGMLLYLDQISSIGPNSTAGQRRGRGLNENLAREVLELHTLGVGSQYSQTDVRQFAELLTGLQIGEDGMNFNSRASEPLQVDILGKTYRHGNPQLQDIMDFLDDLAVHPATGKHLAHKLAVHFVSDNPAPDLVNAMESVFKRSNGDLHEVYRTMLEHPASSSAEREKVKQPTEFVVSAIRALDIGEALMGASMAQFREAVHTPLQAMGQNLFRPAGPDGWSEEASDWITPSTLTARIEWVTKLAEEYVQDIDPRELLTEVLGDVSPELQIAVTGAETKWEGVALLLVSPEFNRR